ncbi:hypothetical protein FIBSPDRAFT_924529 [Athelia psychrophila]|uniref:F-box domain-containing protein n=1 Tax=Athelia psychrophila TaxID=1759441 RepID=A0A166WAI0_9AGAM|nr:hypothetical protein FIBSPDRAFT_924529 [Fibularhizoctonia sp. CBS 109695]
MDTAQSLSPALRLYHELIATIMQLCIPDTQYLPTSVSSHPLVMSQVCHSWRAVALTETLLWASIAIEMTARNAISVGLLAKTWLERAGTRPLRISLSLYGDAMSSQHMDTILTVYQFSSQWQEAKLFLPMSALQPPPELIQHNFPLLEDLSLAPAKDYHSDDFLITTFQTAPLLRKVTLTRDFEFEFYNLPFHQITRLDVNIMLTVEECLPLLSVCSALEYCSINIIALSVLVQTGTIVTLKALQHLSIYTYQDLSEFLDHLTLPALRTLEIRHDFETANIFWPQRELEALIARSSCSLQRLLLSEIRMTHVDLWALLEVSPKLSELEIDSHGPQPCVTDDVLRGLTPTSAMPHCLAPELQVLKLIGDFAFNQAVLLTMIESRWHCSQKDFREVKRLHELSLCLMDDLSPGVLEQLQRFNAEGLILSLS